MYVSMWLTLHRVGAEVAEEAKASGAVLGARFRGRARHLREDIGRPHLELEHVSLGDGEQHDWNPVEDVVKDDDVVVLVLDPSRLAVRDDLAEDAISHRKAV